MVQGSTFKEMLEKKGQGHHERKYFFDKGDTHISLERNTMQILSTMGAMGAGDVKVGAKSSHKAH